MCEFQPTLRSSKVVVFVGIPIYIYMFHWVVHYVLGSVLYCTCMYSYNTYYKLKRFYSLVLIIKDDLIVPAIYPGQGFPMEFAGFTWRWTMGGVGDKTVDTVRAGPVLGWFCPAVDGTGRDPADNLVDFLVTFGRKEIASLSWLTWNNKYLKAILTPH